MQINKISLFGIGALVLTSGVTVRAQDNGQTAVGVQAPAGGTQRRQQTQIVHLSDLSPAQMGILLKLSDDQKTKIQAVLDKRAADYKTLVLPPDQQGSAPAVREANAKRLDMANKADADIETILTDDQKKALPDFKKNIGLYQRAGLPLELIPDLKLTDAQMQKITEQATQNQRAMRQKAREAQQAGATMTPAQRQAMLKENRDKILTLLTPEQRAMVDKYDKERAGNGGATPAAGEATTGTKL